MTATSAVTVDGVVTSGVGEGAYFMALDWVRGAVRGVLGFDPYPGTLNVRLENGAALARWRERRDRDALRLPLPAGESCGGALVPVRIADRAGAGPRGANDGQDGAVIVPEVTRYGEDTLEVIAPVRLRDRLGVRDGDRIVLLFR